MFFSQQPGAKKAVGQAASDLYIKIYIDIYILHTFSFFLFLSNLVLKRLLDKLPVTCPNSDSCKETSQRGILEDHLKYRYKDKYKYKYKHKYKAS